MCLQAWNQNEWEIQGHFMFLQNRAKWFYFKILEGVCFYLLLLAKLQKQRLSSAQLCSWTDLLVHVPQTSAGHCSSQTCRNNLNVVFKCSQDITRQMHNPAGNEFVAPGTDPRNVQAAGFSQHPPEPPDTLSSHWELFHQHWLHLDFPLPAIVQLAWLHLLILAPFPLEFPTGNKRTLDCTWSWGMAFSGLIC